jgi:enterochelin esterase-like enzyme
MKKVRNTLIPVVILFLIVLAGIGLYYRNALSQAESSRVTDAQLAEASAKVPVTFRVAVPDNTPGNQRVYLSGSSPALGSWQAAGVALEPTDDGHHTATVELTNGVEYGYKITRGTWSTVETGVGETDTDFRTVRTDDATEIDVAVDDWIDNGESDPNRVTLSGDIRMHKKLPGDGLEQPRDLIVWLPPNYDQQPQRRYPVIYLQDGQNLFDQSQSYRGVEWGVDETAGRLIEAGTIAPVIVVGIGNTEDRSREFPPGGELHDAFADFVVAQIKPLIDETYRTQPGPEATAIGGAGLGAVASLAIVDQHPETFGHVVALAPRQWGADAQMLDQLDWSGQAWSGVHAWVDAPEVAEQMQSAGLASVELDAFDGDENNEDAWADAVPAFLTHLFGTE